MTTRHRIRNRENAMDYIPVINVLQVELLYAYDGENVENVIHYLKPSAWDLNDALVVGDDIVSNYNTIVKANVASTLVLREIRMTDLTTQTGFVYNYGTGLPIAGTAPGAQLPNNCAVVITKRTALRGRSYRGRIYAMGLTEAGTVGNQVLAGFTTPWINFFLGIRIITIEAETAEMVVVSRRQNSQWLAIGIATPVVTFTTDGVVDSQRRRLPGRGG